MTTRRATTTTSAFGVGRREGHDASEFYARFSPPQLSDDDHVAGVPELDDPCILGDARHMTALADDSIALVVTSPPYFVGKEYEQAVTSGAGAEVPASYGEFLQLLHDVFAECARVLEPGGRIAVNVANLGRKPYRSLAADVIGILEDLGLLMRGEIIWQKARSTSGSCAWGSFASPANPVLRDTTERVLIAAKGRFDRARPAAKRRKEGLPWEATISNDEFLSATLDVWEIAAESARRVKHPAPFPVELPRRLIDLYTYAGDAVLDPFMGSGSTLVAAVEAGRVPVGYDLDPDYVALARSRTEEAHQRLIDADTHTGSEDADGVDDDGSIGQEVVRETATARAERLLLDAGFIIDRHDPAIRGTGTGFTFAVSSPTGSRFYVDVPGGFTTSKPGLVSTEAVWRLLGMASVLAAKADGDPDQRLLVLTPALPRPRTQGDRALRTVGPEAVFDVIDMADPDAVARLGAYADSPPDGPISGFW
ncbi:MAG: site-specific DNA-methyltransferase [Actinomycetota bacterium]